MASPELLALIDKKLLKGHSQTQIRKSLLVKGYSDEDLNGAFALKGISALQPLPTPFLDPYVHEQEVQKSSSSLFLWLIFIILLLAGIGEVAYILQHFF